MGYESRSWLCMFCPHSQGRHHIASSGRKWTCLFWLVQRIISPSPPPPSTSSYRFPALQLRSNNSEWLAAPVNVITYQSEIMSHPPTPPAPVSLEKGVLECRGRETLSESKGQRRRLSKAGRPGPTDDVTTHLVTQRIKGNGGADVKTRGGCVLAWSLHLHGRESMEWEKKKQHRK